MSSSEEEEVEEDPRIAKLYSKCDKLEPEAFAAYVEELGGKDAIVLGGMCTDAAAAKMHFVVHALIDADDGTLAECVTERRKLLKAVVAVAGEGAGKNLIAAMEGWVCNEVEEGAARASAIQGFGKALKVLWEYEVVSEESIRA